VTGGGAEGKMGSVASFVGQPLRFVAITSLSLFLLLAGAPCRAEGPPTAAAPSSSTAPEEITVTAPRGSAFGGVTPFLELSQSELEAYGANSLSELVEALTPLTRSDRSNNAAIVLINGRLAGQTEFQNLIPEAIERVQVLPEVVALQYGFSENQRVLNFILREHFSAVPLRTSDGTTTEGGGTESSGDASLVRIENDSRATLAASYRDTDWLRESDRGIDAADSFYRTLQPETTETKVSGTLSRSIFGISASVEASLDFTNSKSLQGIADTESSGMAIPVIRPLKETIPQTTAQLDGELTGQLSRFVWGATLTYQHAASRSTSETGVDSLGDTLVDSTDSGYDAAMLQLSLSGPIAFLAAGPVIANAKISAQYQGIDSQSSFPGASPDTSHLSRTVESGYLNVSVPLASRSRDVLPSLGDLDATFNTTLDSVSDFGTLLSVSAGIDWKVRETVRLDAIYTDRRTAPTLQQLLAPPVYTPNVELFDFVTGQTAYVTEITGGNDSLSSTDNHLSSLGISLGPYFGKSVFSSHFEDNRIHDAIGPLPPVTPDVELAFPERYIRDDDGNLIEVDDRWVNMTREVVDDLKTGFNIWIPIGASPGGSPKNRPIPSRIDISLVDTWYLHDTTLVRDGVPILDLLNGAPSGVTGGQPRHRVNFRVLAYRSGLGASVGGTWRSATVVGGADSSSPLFFSSLTTINSQVFADLDRMPRMKPYAWSRGMRFSLGVVNLFDKRRSVHDAAGLTPLAFEPGYLDPAGRTVSVTIRKVF
jgi:iron complex outermembrane recepter protein